jgi:hypothetical protein
VQGVALEAGDDAALGVALDHGVVAVGMVLGQQALKRAILSALNAR